jgi:hypothetical protein
MHQALLLESDKLNDEKCISLHCALGKSYDDLKEYKKPFLHFIEGARLKRGKLHYDAGSRCCPRTPHHGGDGRRFPGLDQR